MALHLHRAERTDLLADGLGALLANPLPDPFAEELVLVPARGVERWLSQRLSHVLGAGSKGDGVCAGVSFRSPASLIAEITGTVDDDPWSPGRDDVAAARNDRRLTRSTVVRHPGEAPRPFRRRRRSRIAKRPKVFGGATAGRAVRLLRAAASATAHRLAGRQRPGPRCRPALATGTVARTRRAPRRRSPARPPAEDRLPAAGGTERPARTAVVVRAHSPGVH